MGDIPSADGAHIGMGRSPDVAGGACWLHELNTVASSKRKLTFFPNPYTHVRFAVKISDAYSIQINLITSYESRAYITINPKAGSHDGGAIWLGFWAEVHYNPLVAA